MMASTEETSVGFAVGTAAAWIDGAAGAALCDFEASCAETTDARHPANTAALKTRNTPDITNLRGLGLRTIAPPQPPHLKPCAGQFSKNPHEIVAPAPAPAHAPGCIPDCSHVVNRTTQTARAIHAPYRILQIFFPPPKVGAPRREKSRARRVPGIVDEPPRSHSPQKPLRLDRSAASICYLW